MQKLRDNSLKFAALIFFGGFFIGYTIRFFDIIPRPLTYDWFFPIYKEAVLAMESYGGYANEFTIKTFMGGTELEALDVLTYNLMPLILIIGGSVLFGIPSMIMIFIVGIGAGSSLAELIQFTPVIMNIKVLVTASIFVLAMIYSSSAGFHICSYLYDTVTSKQFKVEKSFYDHLLLASGLVIAGIVLQYILLVI